VRGVNRPKGFRAPRAREGNGPHLLRRKECRPAGEKSEGGRAGKRKGRANAEKLSVKNIDGYQAPDLDGVDQRGSEINLR